jgi:hypothetical protein
MKVLDTVVLKKDIPQRGLKHGDIGAIVEVYEPDGIEVEFVTGSGKTQALITLRRNDVRPAADSDMLTARPMSAA